MKALNFILLITLLTSCQVKQKENSSINNIELKKNTSKFDISISEVLRMRGFLNKKNEKNFYESIRVKNDSIFTYAKIDSTGFKDYGSIISQEDLIHLDSIINDLEKDERVSKKINPSSGLLSLVIQKNDLTIDSVIDINLEWNKYDLQLFDFLNELINSKTLTPLSYKKKYPSWELVKPPVTQ